MSHLGNTTTTTTTLTTPPLPPLPQKPLTSNQQFPKRIQVTDTSGWTHIIRGSKAQKKQSYIKPMAHLKPKEVDSNMKTMEQVSRRLQGYTRDWEKSECRERLQKMIEEDILMSDNINISNCICLGLGSLTGGVNGSKSSWYELVTLIWILEILGKKYTIKDVYMQDPQFNHMDNAFLESLGYTILQVPEALSKLTEDTFLFAPHLEYQHVASSLKIAQPAFYIGSELEFWMETGPNNDDDARTTAKQIFQSFLGAHSSRSMPSFDPYDQWWRYITICWNPSTRSTVQPLQSVRRWSNYLRSQPLT